MVNQIWKRIIPFALALSLGVAGAYFVKLFDSALNCGNTSRVMKEIKIIHLKKGPSAQKESERETRIARTVVLKVSFYEDKEPHKIELLQGLPDGLTEKAIADAESMRVEAISDDGKPLSILIVKIIEYHFIIS